MCGIVAVIRRPSGRAVPDLGEVLAALDGAAEVLAGPAGAGLARRMAEVADRLEAVDGLLRGSAGLACLLAGGGNNIPGAAGLDPTGGHRHRAVGEVDARAGSLTARVAAIEVGLDEGVVAVAPELLELTNAALVRLKDVVWAISRDRLGMARRVADLMTVPTAGLPTAAAPPTAAPPTAAGAQTAGAALDAWWSIEVALSALDRLEVRGRDSAGLHLI
ncbi:MAG: hypothetical protein ACRDY0_13330, partial [Acidimicrobiales bacterium]